MEKFTSSPVGVPENKGDFIIDVKHLNRTLVFYFIMCYTNNEKEEGITSKNQEGIKNENLQSNSR